MERNQLIAIVVIIIIVGGAAGYLVFFAPPPQADLIIVGTTDSVESSIDMAQSYDYFGWEMIMSLSSGLVDIEPGSEAGADDITAALATSWTSSAGGTIWDFTLRENVLFPDGREFNATDVKYTFDRNCNLTGDGLFELDGPQLNMGYAGPGGIIDNVTIVSEFVARFYLQIAFAPFLQLMACQASYMVDRAVAPMDELVEYDSTAGATLTPNALGPYLLQSWSRIGGSDEEIRLVRNPDYWDAANGLPKTETIVVKMYASDTALASAMTSGEIDIAYRQLTAVQIESFRTNTAVKVWEGIGAQIQYLCFNQDIYPYNETNIRRGITAAINRTHVTESVFLGTFDPLFSMVPAGMAYHTPAFDVYGNANYSYTIDMLAPFGYNATHPLTIELYYESSGHYPQSQEQALVYEADWEASGVIEVSLNGLEWPSYRLARNEGTMPVFIYGWYPDFIDPDNYEFLPFASWLNLGYNSTYPQGGIDQNALWQAGRSATTDIAREAAYVDLQELQAEECSVIPLWQSATTAVSKLNVYGIVLDITVSWRHWLLYIE
ncbi:MAG: ABC transporter substrate-binding protein [Candidatus Thorarchaeota archaeon]